MLGRLFGKTVASRRGLDEETEGQRETERESGNSQDLPFGHYVDEEKRDTNQDLPFGQYVQAHDGQTHGLEGGSFEPPQYARTLSDRDGDGDGDGDRDRDRGNNWSTSSMADELMISLVEAVLSFNAVLLLFTTILTCFYLFGAVLEEDLFFANVTNATNSANSTVVIEVNELFILAINRAFLPVMMSPSVPLILFLARIYDKDLPLGEKERDLDGLPCWCIIVVIVLFFGGPGGAAAVLVTSLWTSHIDFVALFNIPETYFVPGNEEAANSLGLALMCMIFVLWFLICCKSFCCPAEE